MFSMAAYLVFPLVFSGLACPAGDCKECEEPRLCDVHQALEEAALKEWGEDLRAKDPARRIAALRSIAALTADHRNAPSRRAAQWIARALQDDSPEVRREAAFLLGKGQHPEAALDALVEALDDVRAEVSRYGRRERGNKRNNEELDALIEFTDVVASALATLPDDRVVHALATFLGKVPNETHRGIVQHAAEALVVLEAQEGIEAIIARMSLEEDLEARRESRTGKARERSAEKTLHELLHGLGQSRGWDDMPAGGENADREWKHWYSGNKRYFPARLGRVSVATMGRVREQGEGPRRRDED